MELNIKLYLPRRGLNRKEKYLDKLMNSKKWIIRKTLLKILFWYTNKGKKNNNAKI